MNSELLFKLQNAGLKAADNWLVRHIDLELSRGEIVTLIGPNGSGKSTTAKLALGLAAATEGSVWKASDIKSAYVPQKLAIDWTLPLTVERFMHLTGKSPEDRIASALAETGSSDLRHRQIQGLSGGELQRVLFARAISKEPDLLVLDEPAQGVDFAGEIEMYELINTVRDRLGCGILLISHDLHVVMASTDRVLCLNGHVCCQGTPTAVASSEEYKQLFGHRAAQGLAVYQHHHDHTHLPDGRVQHADGTVTDTCRPQSHEDGSGQHDHA